MATRPAKDWQDRPSVATPLDAAGMEDLEDRVFGYAEDQVATRDIPVPGASEDGFVPVYHHGTTAYVWTGVATSTTVDAAVAAHSADTTAVHGITDTSTLLTGSSSAGGDVTGTLSNLQLAAGVVTATEVNTTLKASGSAATTDESLRRLGTGSTHAAAGDDSRFPSSGEKNALAGSSGTPGSGNKYVTDADARNSDTRTPTDGSVTAAKVAATLKPSGSAATSDEALRAIGTTGSTAAAGNDSRLSDTRTPTDGSVTAAKLAASLKPSGSAATTDEAVRALGTGANNAAAGNDSRLPTSGQKDALAGTSGTPSTSNPYATKDTSDGLSGSILAHAGATTSVHGISNTSDLTLKSTLTTKGDIYAASAASTPARVAAGANGQALVADSAQTAGVKFSAQLDRDYGQAGIYCPCLYVGRAGAALTASRAYFGRVAPSRNMTITAIAFIVTTAGADTAVTVGLYTFSGSTLTQIGVSSSTTGVLNSLGIKSISLTSGTALTAGTVYYAGFSCDTGTTASITMSALGASSGGNMFGTSLGTMEMVYKAASHPLASSVSSLSTDGSAMPTLALKE